MFSAVTVSVAMATFNGEKYLLEQLKSIADQDLLPSELVVCDDCSTDRTMEILQNFSANAPFPVRVYINETNLGFSDNFLKSASLCRGEFVAFSDQDDIWLRNKIKDAVAAINKYPNTALILQNAKICNHELEVSGRIFPDFIRPGHNGPKAQFGFWVWPGFLQTFRASLLDETAKKNRPRSYFPSHRSITHDKLTCLLANALGGVVVLDEPAALYRRHEGALTGDFAVQGLRERVGKALPVGSDHYLFLAEVAAETAIYLRHLGEVTNDLKAQCFMESADSFDLLARIQSERANLYDSRSIFRRLGSFSKIVLSGGYLGPPVAALGWKSLAKDLLRVIGLLSTSQTSRSS